MKQKIIYYSDEVNDDFAGTNIKKKPLPENYVYINEGAYGKFKRIFWYYLIVHPILWLIHRTFKRVKYVNKKALKGFKKQSCFIYGNHTSMFADAFNPSYLAYPRPADIIINSDATSITGLGWLIKTLGGFPIPDTFAGMKKFNAAIERAVELKHWIAVYPEAHIWYYHTKIRNFPATSFAYPVKLKTPVFAYTMTYKKRKFFKRPKRVVYIDGPFYGDENLPRKEAVQKLRDEVYFAMCERAKNSDCEYIKYVYRPEEKNGESDEEKI